MVIFNELRRECSDFISQSNGIPIYNYLPSSYSLVKRVKARKRKFNDEYVKYFNKAFETKQIVERSIFAYTFNSESIKQNEDDELYYVFPKNGFNFIYNTQVNKIDEIKSTYDKVSNFLDERAFIDLIKNSYKTTDIRFALYKNCEILFYGISCFYVIKASQYPVYSSLYYNILNVKY